MQPVEAVGYAALFLLAAKAISLLINFLRSFLEPSPKKVGFPPSILSLPSLVASLRL
jgi:hypothetical protein